MFQSTRLVLLGVDGLMWTSCRLETYPSLLSVSISNIAKKKKSGQRVRERRRYERGLGDQLTNIPLETFGLDVSAIYAHWQDPARLTHGIVIDLDFVLTLFSISPESASNQMLDKLTHRPQHPSHGLFIQNINFPLQLVQHGHCMDSLVHPSTQSAK